MKRRPHQISVACASARDIAVYGTGDRVMFDQIGTDGRLDRRGILGFMERDFAWKLGARAAPGINLVLERQDSTVCDNAAHEICPIWPGQPMTAHQRVPDIASVEGSPEEIERAFHDAFIILDRRISLFLSLPLATLENLALQRELDRIGRQ
jgi:hypothetical protein